MDEPLINSSCSRKMKATTVNTDVSSSSDSGNCNSNNTLLPILTQKNRKTSSRKLSYRMDSEVADAFRLFDRDKDGRVTRSEIVDLIVSLDGDPECPHLQELLKASDENANGSVDYMEFMKLWADFKGRVGAEGETEEDIKVAFREYDLDNDGYITKDEMVEAIGKMGFVSNKEEEASRCLNEMDLDGDGKVSFAEFMVKWKIT